VTLTDGAGRPLAGQTVTLVSAAGDGTILAATPGFTSGDGSTVFAATAAPATTATLTAYFGEAATPVPGGFSDQRTDAFAASRSLPLRPGISELTDSTHGTARFGTKVDFTLSLGSPSGSGTAPTGSVSFTVDGTLVATVPLPAGDGSDADVATTALLPGTHTISASFAGDANFLPVTRTVSHAVTCDTIYTGAVKRNLNLKTSGQATCLLNARIGGSIRIGAGAVLAVVGSTAADGSLTAQKAGQIMICGSRIGGPAAVLDAGALVVAGDPGHSQCAPNTFGHGLLLRNDSHGVEVIGNTTPFVDARKVSGPGPYPGDGTTIAGNHP
jgi:hypothetical protein